MKARNILIFILGALILPLYLASCGEDRWAAYAEQTKTARWIEDTMRVQYYWNEEMPNPNSLNYFIEPAAFYTSLLSKQDGKNGRHYSTIDSLKSSTRSIPYTDYSYGFQFSVNRVADNDTALLVHVLYVAPGSPAAAINLQRADWILAMNDQPITSKNYTKLYGSSAMQLTVGYYDAESNAIVAYKERRQIASARVVNDNPVHYKNVYVQGEKRVGYLVYNHFSSGITDNSQEYNADLRLASSYFASQQVNEFVLDLRYNNGGLLYCAELMCALLAPATALNQNLGYMEFNSRFAPREVPLSLSTALIGNGANLNLKKLYVLTTSETASASEMVINCLRPYMEVILIGATTEGKNVGSRRFSNRELMITMSPIVCKIFNSAGKSDYQEGFKPQFDVNENSDLARFLPFGNPNELMLATALGVINGSIAPTKADRFRSITPINSSIERRASHAVQID